MFNHLESLGTQESPVKVDLLHLDPTDPDGGCCCRMLLQEKQRRTLLWAAQPHAGANGTLRPV